MVKWLVWSRIRIGLLLKVPGFDLQLFSGEPASVSAHKKRKEDTNKLNNSLTDLMKQSLVTQELCRWISPVEHFNCSTVCSLKE